MIKKLLLAAFAAAAALTMQAQNVTFHGVFQSAWDDNGEVHGTYLKSGYSWVPNGIYSMQWNGTSLTQPVRVPQEGNLEEFYQYPENPDYPLWYGTITDTNLAAWVTGLNTMYGNSGAVKVGNVITTVFSTSDPEAAASEKITVLKWNATEATQIGNGTHFPESSCLESSGMAVNPLDGQVYGLFYMTAQQLPEDITEDPDYFVDSEDSLSSTDAGYCLCRIDLETMELTPITPGLYYYNFVTFAINSQGRAFALTSGGVAGVLDEEGKVYDIDGNPSGATLCEFDLATGLMLGNYVEAIDEETGEAYQEFVNKYQGTGFPGQYRRQSACFDPNNPNIMYWNGYVNSGKGYDENGSWSNLPDTNWKENGKHDTALYAVDINTGNATRLATFTDRYTFSCLWVETNAEEPDYRDVNLDGKWDVTDINIIIMCLLGNDDPANYNGRCDVNKDGALDVSDVNAVIKKMLGE